MRQERVWVGLDLGTSSLKGVALDSGGHVVAKTRDGYKTQRPSAGRAEQDPAAWTTAAQAVLAGLAAASPPSSWGGIGLSGMIPTLVTVDGKGAPVGAAITWEDCRAHETATEIADQIDSGILYDQTGQPLDGRYLLPMWGWIARHEPRRAARCVSLLDAKAYLLRHLTGESRPTR